MVKTAIVNFLKSRNETKLRRALEDNVSLLEENRRLKEELAYLKHPISSHTAAGIKTDTQWGNNILLNVNTPTLSGIQTLTQWGSNAIIEVALKDASPSELEKLKVAAAKIFRDLVEGIKTPNEMGSKYPWNAKSADPTPDATSLSSTQRLPE